MPGNETKYYHSVRDNQITVGMETSRVVGQLTELRPLMNPLQTNADLDSLIDDIGDSRIVMLGEASHGTHEFYTWRALISQRLIEEREFNFIAVEGDWPDCYRLNRYVKNYTNAGASSFEVLHAFDRWPTWMWANWEMVAFAEWMNEHNKSLRVNKKIGFYGLDVYSLWESMEAIINYMRKVDPQALELAERAFQCFEPYRKDEGSSYAYASLMVPDACTREVVDLLKEIRLKMPQYNSDRENVFSAQQNAFVMVNAEKYYRKMLRGGTTTWNIRDTHMMETLSRLLEFHGKRAKAIVWAHNTHIGDARATDMSQDGMHNLGELARRRYGVSETYLVGFGSYEGSVIAASSWGSELKHVRMPQALPGSWESVLKDAVTQNGYLFMRDARSKGLLNEQIGHRAIGVVYNPNVEQFGNYVPSFIPRRYDAFVFLRRTKALHPLHVKPDGNQMPETYPFGV